MEHKTNWIPIQSLAQLKEIELASMNETVLLFKHSTRCGVSKMVLKQFENEYKPKPSEKTYYLDLLNHRDISNEIAIRYGVEHQSPQLILIKGGEVIYHASHEGISARDMQ